MNEEPKSKLGNFFKKLKDKIPSAIPAVLGTIAEASPAGPAIKMLKGFLGNKKTGAIGDQLLGELNTFSEDDWNEWKLKDRQLQLEELALHNANTDSARKFNLGIQNSATAHPLAKLTPYIIDLSIAFLFVALLGTATWKVLEALFNGTEMPDMTTLMALLGMVSTVFGVILNYHRGSSNQEVNNGAGAFGEG